MNVLHHESDDLESELRALLRRHCADLHPNQPDWDELVSRPRAAVFSLRMAEGGSRGTAGPWRHLSRPGFIAAAAAAVVLAGGVAVKQAASDPENVTREPIALRAAAPSESGFDAHVAPRVYVSDAPDPVEAANEYLSSVGIGPAVPGIAAPALPGLPAPSVPRLPQLPTPDEALPGLPGTPELPTPDRGAAGLPTCELVDINDGVAIVNWSYPAGSATHGGDIYLRSSAGAGAASTSEDAAAAAGSAGNDAVSTAQATWAVVGSTSDGVAIGDVSYGGDRLTFTVTKTADIPGPLGVTVWSNGEQVAVEGDAVEAAAGAAGDSVGVGVATDDDADAGTAATNVGATAIAQLIRLGDQVGASAPLSAAVAEATPVLVRIQQITDDGHVASVTEMAILLPGAGGADGRVDGSSDAGVGGDIDTDLPDAIADARDRAEDVPGGPSLPSVPLPSVPTTLPDLPVPTTLPEDLPALPTGGG